MASPTSPNESVKKRKVPLDELTVGGNTKKQKLEAILDASIPSMQEHDESKYAVLKVLSTNGTGDYGNNNIGIAIVQRKSDSKLLIRKILRPGEAPGFKEIRIHRELHHESILPVEEAYSGMSETKVGNVTRRKPAGILYVPLCDLENFDRLVDPKTPGKKMRLPEPFFCYLLQGLLEANIHCQTGFSTIRDFLASNEKKITKTGSQLYI